MHVHVITCINCLVSTSSRQAYTPHLLYMKYHLKKQLDSESMKTTRFRRPRALGCSIPSAARTLLQGPRSSKSRSFHWMNCLEQRITCTETKQLFEWHLRFNFPYHCKYGQVLSSQWLDEYSEEKPTVEDKHATIAGLFIMCVLEHCGCACKQQLGALRRHVSCFLSDLEFTF